MSKPMPLNTTPGFQEFGLAWEAGANAYRRGLLPTVNPYLTMGRGNTELHEAWAAGYWKAHNRASTF
jgi:hypothetical protein